MWGSAGGWVQRARGCPWERGHHHCGVRGQPPWRGQGRDEVLVPDSLCEWIMLNSELAGSCARHPSPMGTLRRSCPASARAEGSQMHRAGSNSTCRAECLGSTGGLCCRQAAQGAQAEADFQLPLCNGATQLSGPMTLLAGGQAHQLPAGSGLQLLHPWSQQLKIALLKSRCCRRGAVAKAPAQPAAAALRALGAQGQRLTVGKDRGKDSSCPKERQRGRITGRG